jgi:hypothetical protein
MMVELAGRQQQQTEKTSENTSEKTSEKTFRGNPFVPLKKLSVAEIKKHTGFKNPFVLLSRTILN